MKNIKINICINIGCENFIYTIFMIRATFWESSSLFFLTAYLNFFQMSNT